MALRIDIGRLKPARTLADGRVRAEAHITRAGVFEYEDAEGKVRRELRTPEEVFAPDSLDSFAQVPVTNNHPPEKVTSRNARRYMIGASGDRVERDDDHVRTMLMFADGDTLDEIKRDGKVEVSCGYTCDIVDGGGTHPVYGRYDAVQTNIRGNHIAIVHRARAGSSARVRLDAKDVIARARSFAESTRAGGMRLDARDAAVVRSDAGVLTNSVDGHQHLVDTKPDYGDRMSGMTSWASSEDGVDHSHAWVRNSDGSVTIAESNGHMHVILALDSAPRKRQDDDVHHSPRGRPMPAGKKKDEITVEAAAELLAKAQTRADNAERSLEDERKRADTAEGRVESLEEQVKKLQEGRVDEAKISKLEGEVEELRKKLAKEVSRADEAADPKRLADGVRRRAKIEKAAAAILGDKMVTDSASDREIMCAVVERLHDVKLTDARSDEYVSARFDAAVEGWAAGITALDQLREVTRTRSEPEPRDDAATAHAEYVDRQRNAWRPQTTK